MTPQETIREILDKYTLYLEIKHRQITSISTADEPLFPGRDYLDIDQALSQILSLFSTHEAKVREEIIKNMPLRIEHTAENGHSYETDEDKGWNNYRSQVLKILEGK